MKHIHALVCSVLMATAASSAGAAILHVGPTRAYTTLQAAIDAATSGDTILVDSGTYVGRDCTMLFNGPSNITVRGIGPTRPVLDMGTDHSVSIWGKGICTVTPASGTITFENLEFMRAAGRDLPPWNDNGHNGAAVRYDGSGLLTIRDCYIHDCEDGVLATSQVSYSVLFEHTEFHHNGYGQGSTHNMYINNADSFTLRYCYVHNANVGHEVKSRAKKNYILYNRIMNQDGNASYEVDIPNGGETYIIGNIIQQGPNTTNRGMIAYGLEGLSNADKHLYVINNTMSNERQNSTDFVTVLNDASILATVANNLLLGEMEGKIDNVFAPTSLNYVGFNNILCNVNYNNGGTSHGPSAYLVSPGQPDYNYHLTAQSTEAINAGADPGTSFSNYALTPLYHYAHPCSFVSRPVSGAIDAGAYEFITAPIVYAGADLSVYEGQAVQLKAVCDNPTGSTPAFSWLQIAGKSASLTGAGTDAASFTAPVVTFFPQANLSFQATADNGSASGSDIVDIRVYILGDITHDDVVNSADLAALSAAWTTSSGHAGFNSLCDLNDDGVVNIIDLLRLAPNWNRNLP